MLYNTAKLFEDEGTNFTPAKVIVNIAGETHNGYAQSQYGINGVACYRVELTTEKNNWDVPASDDYDKINIDYYPCVDVTFLE